MKQLLHSIKDKFVGKDLKMPLRKLENYEQLVFSMGLFSFFATLLCLIKYLDADAYQTIYLVGAFFFIFTACSPKIIFNFFNKKRKEIDDNALNYLNEMMTSEEMYKIELILFLNTELNTLADADAILNNIKKQKAGTLSIHKLSLMFSYLHDRKPKNTNHEIENFLKINQMYLNKSINELEILAKDKVNDYLIEEEKKHDAINDFLKERNKDSNKIALKL